MIIMIRTKTTKPDGIEPLIIALRKSHKSAEKIADLIEGWDNGQDISDDDIDQLNKWLRNAKCDKSRKIARCIVKCIYNNWLECIS